MDVNEQKSLGAALVGALLDSESAAAYLGVKPETLRVWRSREHSPLVPYVRIGRLVKYRKQDLDDWISRQVVTTQVAA